MNIGKVKKIPSVLAAVILISLWLYVFVIHWNIHDLSDNAAFHREGAGWGFMLAAMYSGCLSGLFRPWRWYLALVLFCGFFALHYLWFPVILYVRAFLGLLFLWFVGWVPGVSVRLIAIKIFRTVTDDYERYRIKRSAR